MQTLAGLLRLDDLGSAGPRSGASQQSVHAPVAVVTTPDTQQDATASPLLFKSCSRCSSTVPAAILQKPTPLSSPWRYGGCVFPHRWRALHAPPSLHFNTPPESGPAPPPLPPPTPTPAHREVVVVVCSLILCQQAVQPLQLTLAKYVPLTTHSYVLPVHTTAMRGQVSVCVVVVEGDEGKAAAAQ